MGTGHVMRCLALAQAWQDAGGAVLFLSAAMPGALEERLRLEGIEIRKETVRAGGSEDAASTVERARGLGADWVVVDGYHFGDAFQKALKQAGLRLLLVDDYGQATHYECDIVLNQNLHAREELYAQREPYTRLLLGTRYVLLRREFLAYRGWERQVPPVARNILVTLGGADPGNSSAKVVEALRGLDLEAKIVVGASNPHLKGLQASVKCLPRAELLADVQEMPQLMAWADVAVSSGGTTVWELAFMNLPALIGQLSAAEEVLASGLASRDLFVRIGWFRDATPSQIRAVLRNLVGDEMSRARMAKVGRTVVDGLGCTRVTSEMLSALERGSWTRVN